jgi:hypothetical protein
MLAAASLKTGVSERYEQFRDAHSLAILVYFAAIALETPERQLIVRLPEGETQNSSRRHNPRSRNRLY